MLGSITVPGDKSISHRAVLLALTVYVLTSGAIAIATGDKCGGMQVDKTWQFFPPGWVCTCLLYTSRCV